jgi:hypothetical protein
MMTSGEFGFSSDPADADVLSFSTAGMGYSVITLHRVYLFGT